jgi:UDP-N-acetylmuramoylalanine--D-glutamate ligase
MNLDIFDNKDVVFVGVGRGRSFEGFRNFIKSHGKALSISGVDKKAGERPLDFLKEYDSAKTVFIKNEAIPSHEMPVPYLTPMNIFFEVIEKLGARTVGITGTKGKSTTTALTSAMLKAGGLDVVLAGNIGVSVFDEIDRASAKTVFVLELSSYQLSDIKHSPNIAVCINLYNDHSDWHGSRDLYWKAKQNIVKFSKKNDLFIFNPNFQVLEDWANSADCRHLAIDTTEVIDMSKTKLYGEHNRLNALAARMVARELGVSDTDSQKALDDFTPLEHRMEFVANKNNHIFINDAIGMTPESTLASMKAVNKKHGRIGCLLLGGQDRGYDFGELVTLLLDYKIPNIVLFPDTVNKFKQLFPSDYQPNIFETRDMAEAVLWADKNTPEDSVVLLSTAAPSYSVWTGFEEKGSLFKQAVDRLA